MHTACIIVHMTARAPYIALCRVCNLESMMSIRAFADKVRWRRATVPAPAQQGLKLPAFRMVSC